MKRNYIHYITHKSIFVVSVLIFRIILDLGYLYFVSPNYEYSGFWVHIDTNKLLESYWLTIFLAFFLPFKLRKPSDFLMVFFVLKFLPTLSLYGLRADERYYLYIMFIGVLVVMLSRHFPIPEIPRVNKVLSRKFAFVVSLVIVIAVSLSMIWSGGLKYFNLDLTRVYEFRRPAGELINYGIMGYLNSWAFKVFNIFILAVLLLNKRYFLVVLFFLVQIFFFGVTHAKSPLFYPMVIFGLMIFRRKINLSLMAMVFSGIIVIAFFTYVYFDYLLISSMFIRRVFFVPALNNFGYYEFFDLNGFVYMSNSVLSSFIEYPYSENPVYMVSYYLSGHYETHKNNGFIATSFMHFGIFGVLVFSYVVGILFKLVDKLAIEDKPIWFTLAIVFVPFNSLLTSGDLTTSLLTHGIAVSLFLLWLFRNEKIIKGSRVA